MITLENYNDFCHQKGCEEYIEWTFEAEGSYAHCTSCKLIGQSYDITEYPAECPFIDEIKNVKLKQQD